MRSEIPVYDGASRGSFVQGDGPGREVVGVMNDWLVDPDIYAVAEVVRAGV